MRIKRFIAPDMRTALRMIRDEQGADAVILSNRVVEGGAIEVVAATDYDEALVAQALRAATPGLQPTTVAAAGMAVPQPATAALPAGPATFSSIAAATPAHAAPAPALRAPMRIDALPGTSSAAKPATATTPREGLMSRARAALKIGEVRIGDGPTLAELSAARHIPSPSHAANTTLGTMPAPTRFEEMMAVLNPVAIAPADGASANTIPAATDARATDSDYLISLSSAVSPAPAAPARSLHAVASTRVEAPDPTIVAMRDELASMRQLMEKQMEQLSLERLRGSPARAAAFNALIGYGCADTLAQAVAAGIDPRLPPAQIHESMFAELARLLTVTHREPIDDGGVIALVGPTGAGKTTTVAKLAARYAARHCARDVALVTTDGDRTGAREQLHAFGRRLGITVCDTDNGEALGHTLDQLVDYPLVLVDTAGYGVRDRAGLRQILWLRTSSHVRSLLVLPANAHPHDLGEVIRRYRPAAPEGVVLTKLDETGRLGAALSVLAHHDLSLAYTSAGQQVTTDLEAANAVQLVMRLEKTPRAADNPLATEDRHALA